MKEIVRNKRRLLCALCLALGCGDRPVAAQPPAASAKSATTGPAAHVTAPDATDDTSGLNLQLKGAIVDGSPSIANLTIGVDVDGLPLDRLWSNTFEQLFVFLDRDGSESLDPQEFSLAPTPFAIRQVLWGQIVPFSATPIRWKDVDFDGSGTIDRQEMTRYYRQQRVGEVKVAVGIVHITRALNSAIENLLDKNNDGVVSLSELRSAETSFRSFDSNGDELICPSELCAGIDYPSAHGSMLLRPSGQEFLLPAELKQLPLAVLPTKTTASVAGDAPLPRSWPDNASRERQETVGELHSACPERWRVRLLSWDSQEDANGQKRRLIQSTDKGEVRAAWTLARAGNVRLHCHYEEGALATEFRTAQRRYLANFDEADANRDGVVDHDELSAKASLGQLQRVGVIADLNLDGALQRAELNRWLALKRQIAVGHCLLTVLDHSCGLFELIDSNHDGVLSVRELRNAAAQAKKEDCLTDGDILDPRRTPHQLICAISAGRPQRAVARNSYDAPEWFIAMDRNRDGDVSRQEFIGQAAKFDRIDQNEDGLLTPQEAEARFHFE